MTRTRDHIDDLATLSDEALVEQVAMGNNRALECLYDRYARPVYGLALKMLNTSELAEDVVQEAFWRVWRRGATFQAGQGKFTSWLFGIAHNLCIDELRRQRSRPTPVYLEADSTIGETLSDDQPELSMVSWHSERRRIILAALQELPDDQRQVVELAYFGGLSQREIAEHLNNPLGTVKTRIRLGLQKIKHVLQTQGISHED